MGTEMDFITGRDRSERKPGQGSEGTVCNPDPTTKAEENPEHAD